MRKLTVLILTITILLSFSALAFGEDLLELLAEELGYEMSEETGFWMISEDQDPMTDELELRLALLKKEELEALNEGKVPTTLSAIFIRYLEGTMELYIRFEHLLKDSDIMYRFDEKDPVETSWNPSADNQFVFFPRRTESLEDFLIEMIESDTFVVRVYPRETKRETSTFETEGLYNALEPYLEELGLEGIEEAVN